MLVLSRKAGEKIHIGEGITIEVRKVAGNRVAIAVQAPREVRVLRGELKHATEQFTDENPATLPLARNLGTVHSASA